MRVGPPRASSSTQSTWSPRDERARWHRRTRSAAAPTPDASRRRGSCRSARRRPGPRPAPRPRRRAPARSGRARDTRPDRSRAGPSGTRRGPARSAAGPTSGADRPARPRRSGPGTARSRRRAQRVESRSAGASSLTARPPARRSSDSSGHDRRSPRAGRSGAPGAPRHDRSASNTTRATRKRLVLVGGVAARVVELVEDVGVDAPRAPLAVVRLGRALALDGHVVRVDLGAHAIEQDPPLAPDRRPPPARRASRIAVSSSTIAPRNWLRTCSPRSATARLAARIASDRVALRSGGHGRPEQRREHRPPAVGVGRLAVHHGARQDPLGRRGIGEQRRPRA